MGGIYNPASFQEGGSFDRQQSLVGGGMQGQGLMGGGGGGFGASGGQKEVTGGGFPVSQSPQGAGRGAADSSLTPITCKQALNVEKSGDSYRLPGRGKLLNHIYITGQILGWTSSGKEVTITITDGTATNHVVIYGTAFLDELKAADQKPHVERHYQFARIFGRIREMNREPRILGFQAAFLSDPMIEMCHHFLHCVQAHLYSKHGALQPLPDDASKQPQPQRHLQQQQHQQQPQQQFQSSLQQQPSFHHAQTPSVASLQQQPLAYQQQQPYGHSSHQLQPQQQHYLQHQQPQGLYGQQQQQQPQGMYAEQHQQPQSMYGGHGTTYAENAEKRVNLLVGIIRQQGPMPRASLEQLVKDFPQFPHELFSETIREMINSNRVTEGPNGNISAF